MRILDLPFDGCIALSKGLALSGPSFLTCKMSPGLAPNRRTSDFNYGKPSAWYLLTPLVLTQG